MTKRNLDLEIEQLAAQPVRTPGRWWVWLSNPEDFVEVEAHDFSDAVRQGAARFVAYAGEWMDVHARPAGSRDRALSQIVKIPSRPRARPDRGVVVRPTSIRWPGGVKVHVVKFGADVRQGVREAMPIGSLVVMHPDAGERLPDGTVRVHEDSLFATAG